MKKEIHPKNYRPVIFVDNGSGAKFLIPSTIETKTAEKWTDGKEYPAHHIEISSASHPFYTNQEKTIDTAGRVEKFKTRQSKAKTKPVKPLAQDKVAEMNGPKEGE
ncbi:MAG: large subunit ribosomal protein [Candidatus Parcubacteria bacterium]|jgi:large subunit ribosomal protein L31|nr:large subunit ribosomal protein [Candidatus Parcubacteria bacterium]